MSVPPARRVPTSEQLAGPRPRPQLSYDSSVKPVLPGPPDGRMGARDVASTDRSSPIYRRRRLAVRSYGPLRSRPAIISPASALRHASTPNRPRVRDADGRIRRIHRPPDKTPPPLGG
jgi:hypothetical protein